MPFLGRTPTQLVDPEVDINGGAIDGVTIGATSASPATVTTFTSTGIDDNATSTAITIDSSENVNIGAVGTTTLTTLTGPFNGDVVKMDGSSGVSDRHLIFSNSSNSQQWDIDAEGGANSLGVLSFSTNSTERMRIDSSGNAAIGATPVAGNRLRLGGGQLLLNNGVEIRSYDTGSSQRTITRVNTSNELEFGWSGSGPVKFMGGGSYTERMRIHTNGNVGIGTTSPSRLLTLSSSGATLLSLVSSGDDNCQVLFGDSASDTVGKVVYAHDTNHMRFETNAAERMRIDAGGSVLIGKTTPTDLHNTWNHLIIGEKGAIISENGAGGIDGITLSDNAYIDADTGNYAYQTTAAASKITQSGGVTTFSNAASGTAGTGLSFTERMRILSTGGITFNGDTSTANALDDYEEGTHNTTISVDNGSATFSQVTLAYTKIGRVVSVAGTFRVNTISSPTGSLSFTLPFTSISGSGELQTGGSVVPNLVANANCHALLPQVAENASACTIFNGTSTSLTDAANTLSPNATYRINLVYYTS